MKNKLFLKNEHYFNLNYFAWVSVFIFFFSLHVFADEASTTPSPSPIELPRIHGKVILDGLSNEAAWSGIPYYSTVGLIPDSGKKPAQPTDIFLAYDDNYLYVAGRLYDDEPDKIQANSRKRDSEDGTSEWFGIVIDSFNDKENGLAFFTTPEGLRWDAAVIDDCRPNNCLNTDWNAPWEVACTRNNQGWFAEMRIPLSSLKFQEIDGKVTMGIIGWRMLARTYAFSVFPEIPPTWNYRSRWKVSHAQEVVLKNIKSKKPVYVSPYLLGGFTRSTELNIDETGYQGINNTTFEAGIDVKYNLTDNLTLDLTVNTDFAQVEADDQEVNLTRFSLFFPEKRTFFQQRASNFDFNFDETNRLFYSRRIGIHEGEPVRLLGGVRLVGRMGNWDIGLLDIQTAKFNDQSSENFGVFRLRRQVFNPYSYMGAIVTTRLGADGAKNADYGIDGIFRLFGNDYLTVKWAQTFEEDHNNRFFSAKSARYHIDWERKSNTGWRYGIGHSRAGAEYNPGIGFEQRQNYSSANMVLGYGWRLSSKKSLAYHRVKGTGEVIWSNDTKVVESAAGAFSWYFQTKSGMNWEIRPEFQFENISENFSLSEKTEVQEGKYNFFNLHANMSLTYSKPFHIKAAIDAGSFYDGSRLAFSLTPRWAISAGFEISSTYQYNRVRFSERDQKLDAHIARLRMLWMPSVKVSGSAFVQYNSDANLFLTNLRLRYNPREGVDIYLVYNEDFNTDRMRAIPVLPLSVHRSVILKFTYTFLM